MQCVTLANGVEGLYINNSRFKTVKITFNFYMPLSKETMAKNALLPCVLTSCSKQYPRFTLLNRRLKELYGACIAQSVTKVDDLQCISISATVLCDRFTPDNEPTVMQTAELLASLIFEPKLNGQAFFEEDLMREKRQLIERIEGEINEKRLYSRRRLVAEMYDNSPYGLPACGTAGEVAQITPRELFETWQNMLRTAHVRLQVVGNLCVDKVFSATAKAFKAIKRDSITDVCTVQATAKRNEVKRVVERQKITQGKLVMGFSSETCGTSAEADAITVMADILGGGPYSLLFENVREKQSLCYYCACSVLRNKGLVMVDSGVEPQNAKLAEKEILKQLEAVKGGAFGDELFESSLRNIKDTIISYNDNQDALDTWYALRINQKAPDTPEQMAARFAEVTRADVVKAAKGVCLNTVFSLMPETAKEEN